MQSAGRVLCCLLVWLAEELCASQAGSIDTTAEYCVIRAGDTALELNREGGVAGAELGPGKTRRALQAMTVLADCQVDGEILAERLEGNVAVFSRQLVHQAGHRCRLIERYKPAGDSIRWEIEISGESKPWSTSIDTRLVWPEAAKAKFWSAWGGDRAKSEFGWHDPLVPKPFADRLLVYGGRSFQDLDAISLPIVTVLEEAEDLGASLVLSPEDLMLHVELRVTERGEMAFSRTNLRISPEHPVRLSMNLIAHKGDWRSGLGWMVKTYGRFFDPPNRKAGEIVGCAAYSSHTADIDAEKLRRMAFRVNWKASFDFPYMGMFIPPVGSDTDEWIDFKGKPTSIRAMRDYCSRMRNAGFHVLSYFNVTEFGAAIRHPAPPRKAKNDADLWKDPQDFLYYRLSDAILPGPDGKPMPSWQGCVAMDPGEPVYQAFLLEQAKRHIDAFPAGSGICIDRMDWLQRCNPRRDDGVSWVDGAPCRSLVVSWHGIMDKLAPMMHAADKVVYCNPHYRRLDLLQRIDGVYDEFGQYGYSLNLCAFLCLRKPLMEWTIDVKELRGAPDDYFQRHLHMGAYPTAPLPGNDHTILPDPTIERIYFDYAPLLETLRGKKWVLTPHVIRVAEDQAKANVFEVPGGYAIPVTFGGNRPAVEVALGEMPGLRGPAKARFAAYHPGRPDPLSIAANEDNGTFRLKVPLVRGCAVVSIKAQESPR